VVLTVQTGIDGFYLGIDSSSVSPGDGSNGIGGSNGIDGSPGSNGS
jgi:hypothetical protein